jgi:hypothetical protein
MGDLDEMAYAQREAESPEAGEFAGGHVGVVPVIVVIGILLLLAYLLFQQRLESK